MSVGDSLVGSAQFFEVTGLQSQVHKLTDKNRVMCRRNHCKRR